MFLHTDLLKKGGASSMRVLCGKYGDISVMTKKGSKCVIGGTHMRF